MKDHRKTILVTGASSGIGRAIAQRLSLHGHYRLLLSGRDPGKLHISKESCKNVEQVTTVVSDLRDLQSANNLYSKVKNILGKMPDIFIHSAGIGVTGQPDDPSECFDLNVNFTVCLFKMFLNDSMTRNMGTLINISSRSAVISNRELPVYGASKAAVLAYLRSMQQNFQNSGVRICSILPGPTDTPMIGNTEGKILIDPREIAELIATIIPLRTCIPQEVLLQPTRYVPFEDK